MAIGGQARGRIASIDGNTGLATAWNPNSNNLVRTIAISSSTVYVGGHFSKIGGSPFYKLFAAFSLFPIILAEPLNSTVCPGSNTFFNISAHNNTGYQWQVNKGSGFVNLSNTGVYSNVTAASMKIKQHPEV